MFQGFFAGNLGKDAETRNVGDTTVTQFLVCCNGKVKGEKVVTFIGCDLWGKRGQSLAQYLRKGMPVTVTGELSLETFQTREGKDKTILRCRVSDIALQGSRNRDDAGEDDAPF